MKRDFLDLLRRLRGRWASKYPDSVHEVIRDVNYKEDTVKALKSFKRLKAWQGDLEERKAKFIKLHDKLCKIYDKKVAIVFNNNDEIESGSSNWHTSTEYRDGVITLNGRLSVVTYLHEFAHALGKDEKGACVWSINLFRLTFPRSFEKAKKRGHMILRGTK